MSIFVTAEIGINHNGDMTITKKLINAACMAGCNAVKFQKRTIDKVYTKEILDSPRESPWGHTQRAQKEGLEFGLEEYQEIDGYCKRNGIEWFASAWDIEAQRFLQKFNLKYNKIASPLLGNDALLHEVAEEGKYTFIATGMSTYEEIDHVVAIFREMKCPFELMHCNSTYPMNPEDANLKLIAALRKRYEVNVGYSGHEIDSLVSCSAAALGATSIERHITLDRTMYGSDQRASIEPDELISLVQSIRTIEGMLGTGEKILGEAELEVRRKLRG